MIEELLDVLIGSPVTADNKYLLVVAMFIVCFGIEGLVEFFGTITKGAKRL